MTEKNKPIFCALAFGSASINNYGNYIPCCNIDVSAYQSNVKNKEYHKLSPDLKMNSKDLCEVRTQLKNGIWPAACNKCKSVEDTNGISMRQIWNESLNQYEIPMNIIVNTKDIRYLDLSLGNKCNSKCMTCNGDNSDQWKDEHEYIWINKAFFIDNEKSVSLNSIDIIEIFNTFSNIHHIALIGGEPTIIDTNHILLKHLISNGASKNIDINYVTNLTGVDEDLLELWKQFRSVGLAVSIDGYKELNEYIRYPIQWKKVETNLRTFFDLSYMHNLNCNLSCTISLLNIHGIIRLLRFWLELVNEYGEKNNNYKNYGIHFNRVIHPEYLKFELLSLKYRQSFLPECEKFLEELKIHPKSFAVYSMKKNVELFMSWLNEDQIKNTKNWQDMKYFIKKSDEFRKHSLQDYAPDLYKEILSLI